MQFLHETPHQKFQIGGGGTKNNKPLLRVVICSCNHTTRKNTKRVLQIQFHWNDMFLQCYSLLCPNKLKIMLWSCQTMVVAFLICNCHNCHISLCDTHLCFYCSKEFWINGWLFHNHWRRKDSRTGNLDITLHYLPHTTDINIMERKRFYTFILVTWNSPT